MGKKVRYCEIALTVSRSLIIGAVAVLFLAESATAGVRAESLHLEVSPGEHTIRAVFNVMITNGSTAPMGEQQFFLYPEMFDESFLATNFPGEIEGRRTHPGSLDIIAVEGGDGRPIGLRKSGKAFVSLVFDPPLDPGEEMAVTFRYEVHVPNHYSCFSAVRGGMYLNGAFYPLPVFRRDGREALQLDDGPVDLRVRLLADAKKMFFIPHRDGAVKVSKTGDSAFVLPDLKEVGLFLANYRAIPLRESDVKATLFTERISKRGRKKIADTVEAVTLFLQKEHPHLLDELDRILIIEAPLRKRVSFFTSYGVVVSDRIFESVYLFRSQHQEALIESIFSYLASRRSVGQDFISRVYSEFVGEILTDEFREFTNLRLRNLRKTVKPVTFIPAFDRIYYERRMPFARSYIRTVYRFGFPGEDFPTTEEQRITGDSIFRVVRSYRPDLKPDRVMQEYFQGEDLLDILAKWDLDGDFLSLLKADPRSDYRVESVKSREGVNEISLVNARKDALREAVKVLVSLDDGSQKELFWDTEAKETTLVVESPPGTKISNVTVDPDLVMEDTDRANNYLKRPLRILLQGTSFDYDFNTGDFSGAVLLNFKRAYDPIHSYFLRLQTDDDSSGAHFFYRRAIRTRQVGGLFWQGGIKYTREKSLIPTEENIVEGAVALDYSSFQFPFFPVRDIRGFIGFTAGFFGRDMGKQFYTLEGRVIKYLKIDLKDTVALKLDTGVVWGDVPDVRLLELGGSDHVRGIKIDEAEVESFAVGTVELRHILTNDLDLDLPWGIFSFQGLAVNLFVDGGTGSFPRNSPARRDAFRASGGVGIFLNGNLFGIAEVRLNFEFAREFDRFSDNDTLFYFKLNQSF